MVKLLEDGKIPYEQPGRHRRILFTELGLPQWPGNCRNSRECPPPDGMPG